MKLHQIQGPECLAVDIAEVIAALDIEVPENLVANAIRLVEATENVCLINQCWRLDIKRFPQGREPLEFPIGPYLGARVRYVNTDGDLVEIPSGDLMIGAGLMGFTIQPAPGAHWPKCQVRDDESAHIIAWLGCGTSPENVPKEMRQKIINMCWELLTTGDSDETRATET